MIDEKPMEELILNPNTSYPVVAYRMQCGCVVIPLTRQIAHHKLCRAKHIIDDDELLRKWSTPHPKFTRTRNP